MTKRDLVKWLEEKQKEAIANVEKQYQEAVNIHNESLHNAIGLKEVADKIQEHLEAAHVLYEELEQSENKEIEIRPFYTGSIGALLNKCLNNNGGVFGRMKNEDVNDISKEKEQLDKKLRESRRKIELNYRNLIINVKRFATAKQACKYLTELGFTITEIDVNKECTELTVEVDKTYLFV